MKAVLRSLAQKVESKGGSQQRYVRLRNQNFKPRAMKEVHRRMKQDARLLKVDRQDKRYDAATEDSGRGGTEFQRKMIPVVVLPRSDTSSSFTQQAGPTAAQKAFETLKNVKYNVPDFSSDAAERNRTKGELDEYLANLLEHTQALRSAVPLPPDNELEVEPYTAFKSTSMESFTNEVVVNKLKDADPDAYKAIVEEGDLSPLIDISFAHLKKDAEPPKVMKDSEYPDWLWELAPSRRLHTDTDLVKIPWENLSEVEKLKLFRQWRKTLMFMNNQWAKTKGRTGDVRRRYDDPFPKPVTGKDYFKERGDTDG